MPTIKDFEPAKKRTPAKKSQSKTATGAVKARRRPGMDSVHHETKISSQSTEVTMDSTTDTSTNETAKTKLNFKGSEFLREKMPKAFEVAETIADDWKTGDFSNVPVDHPLAKKALTASLEKAKVLEKKLEEKGVISGVTLAALSGIEFVKSKLSRRPQA